MSNIILFLSIVNFMLTFFVFLNAKKEKANMSFLAFSFITTMWILTDFLVRIYPYSIYWALSFGLGIFVPTSVLIWIYHLLEEKLSRFILYFIISFSILLFFISSFTSYVVYPINAITPFGYESKMGLLFPFYSIYLASLIALALYKLFKGFLGAEKGAVIKKQQILSLFIGGLIFGVAALIIDFVIPLFFNTFKYAGLVSLTYFPLLLFIIYSIIKHQLFGIKILMAQFLVAIFLSLLLFRFLFSNSSNDYYWNGAVLIIFIFLSHLIIKSMFKDIELNKKLLRETQKNLEFEQRLKSMYSEIAEKGIKERYFNNKS